MRVSILVMYLASGESDGGLLSGPRNVDVDMIRRAARVVAISMYKSMGNRLSSALYASPATLQGHFPFAWKI